MDGADDGQGMPKTFEGIFEILTLPMNGADVEQGKGLPPCVVDFLADVQGPLRVIEGFVVLLKNRVGSAESEQGDSFTPFVIDFPANG